ncbi:MAG: RsmD family RNA methyltransferase [Pyrobaculum sp.]
MVPVLSRWQVEDLVEKREFVSFDLEISKSKVTYAGRYAKFNYGGADYEIALDELPEAGDCEVYALVRGRWRELSIADRHFYKLCVFKRGWAPTLMIDGITMHSVLENPLSLAARKVAGVWGRVFECCTGLGYTAVEALRRGARYVLTVEADLNVLALATYNPYSRGLWSPVVDIVMGDCVDLIRAVRDGAFNYVIHDPPRISHATQRLYSEYLYREFFRILKRGGGLFHYVSQTGTKYRGLNPARRVVEKLRKTGFVVEDVKEGLGVFAKRR